MIDCSDDLQYLVIKLSFDRLIADCLIWLFNHGLKYYPSVSTFYTTVHWYLTHVLIPNVLIKN